MLLAPRRRHAAWGCTPHTPPSCDRSATAHRSITEGRGEGALFYHGRMTMGTYGSPAESTAEHNREQRCLSWASDIWCGASVCCTSYGRRLRPPSNRTRDGGNRSDLLWTRAGHDVESRADSVEDPGRVLFSAMERVRDDRCVTRGCLGRMPFDTSRSESMCSIPASRGLGPPSKLRQTPLVKIMASR